MNVGFLRIPGVPVTFALRLPSAKAQGGAINLISGPDLGSCCTRLRCGHEEDEGGAIDCQPSLCRSVVTLLRTSEVLLIRLRFPFPGPACDGVAGRARAGRRRGPAGGSPVLKPQAAEEVIT